MQGYITASPNSTIKECGFHYGNDTVQWEIKAELIYPEFSVTVDSLDLGEYYAVAYARNGIGTSYGDTVNFRITSAE